MVVLEADGSVWIRGCKGKGGRIRDIPVDPAYAERVLEIAHQAEIDGNKRVFPRVNSAAETVITNLDPDAFPPSELKNLYAMRWGIETSFRSLKYTMGLLHFHAKKVEHILQEIFARLIMYNFSELITSHVVIQKGSNKYVYKANFSAAVHICRQLFLGNVSPPQAETLIARAVSPFRPGRSSPRRFSPKSTVSFIYRIA